MFEYYFCIEQYGQSQVAGHVANHIGFARGVDSVCHPYIGHYHAASGWPQEPG